MAKLLYTLEDHFDVVAVERKGHLSGLLSLVLSRVFAIAGDVVRVKAPHRSS